MKEKIAYTMFIPGLILCLWAVVLLAWNLYYFWFPSVDYEVGPGDQSIAMTGQRGQTITMMLKPGKSLATKWATDGILLNLASPALSPIVTEVVPLREPDWEEEIHTFSILEDVTFTINGEFTIPKTLGTPAVGDTPAGESDSSEPGSYQGSLAGLVLMPVSQGEESYFTDFMELNYDVSLTVIPGQVASGTAWTFTKDWSGPRWRNFLIFAGAGGVLFVTASLMMAPNEEEEDKQEEDGPTFGD